MGEQGVCGVLKGVGGLWGAAGGLWGAARSLREIVYLRVCRLSIWGEGPWGGGVPEGEGCQKGERVRERGKGGVLEGEVPEGAGVCEQARAGAGVPEGGGGSEGREMFGEGKRVERPAVLRPQVEGRVSVGVHTRALGAALLIGGRRAGLGLSPPSPLGGHPVRPARGRRMRARGFFVGPDETAGVSRGPRGRGSEGDKSETATDRDRGRPRDALRGRSAPEGTEGPRTAVETVRAGGGRAGAWE